MNQKPPYLTRLDDGGEQKIAFARAERIFQEDIVILRRSVLDMHDKLARLDAESAQLLKERDRSLIRAEQLQIQLNAIISSSSWQITRSLRVLFGRHPSLARILRRVIKGGG